MDASMIEGSWGREVGEEGLPGEWESRDGSGLSQINHASRPPWKWGDTSNLWNLLARTARPSVKLMKWHFIAKDSMNLSAGIARQGFTLRWAGRGEGHVSDANWKTRFHPPSFPLQTFQPTHPSLARARSLALLVFCKQEAQRVEAALWPERKWATVGAVSGSRRRKLDRSLSQAVTAEPIRVVRRGWSVGGWTVVDDMVDPREVHHRYKTCHGPELCIKMYT